MNKKITVNLALAIAIIAMTVTFVITMLLSMNLFDRTVSNVRAKEVMYNKVAEIDKNVRANYYGEINNDSLYDYMCAGYIAGIGDKNATYYTAKQYLELQGIQNGQVILLCASVIHNDPFKPRESLIHHAVERLLKILPTIIKGRNDRDQGFTVPYKISVKQG